MCICKLCEDSTNCKLVDVRRAVEEIRDVANAARKECAAEHFPTIKKKFDYIDGVIQDVLDMMEE